MCNKRLIILEMANNHMGELAHGIRIINEFKKVTDPFKDHFDFAFKLQLRDVTFVHPDYRDRMDISQIKRFTETKFSPSEFTALKEEIEKQGYISMCTPFDEPSVQDMLDMDFDMYKVASCSFADWPLMEALAKVDKPIVISTAGASQADMDNIVAFFKNRKKNFSIMHCVSSYPTNNEDLELNQINYLKSRYPDVLIGYSTHEAPYNYSAVQMAIAKGSMLFEKHVGVPTDKYKLNAYSCTPEQTSQWLKSMVEAIEMCGISDKRMSFTQEGEKALKGLFRGAFAKQDICRGTIFSAEDLFCAIPATEGQIIARQLTKYTSFTAREDIKANAPIMISSVDINDKREVVQSIVKRVSAMLKEANVTVPYGANCTTYAHFGLDRFDEIGAVLINVLNREYSKTLLVMLPGQHYPLHFHRMKEETFYILSGEVSVTLEGVEHNLKKGDLLTVPRGAEHMFGTEEGVILEEISTTYIEGDSLYSDKTVLDSHNRKITFGYYV